MQKLFKGLVSLTYILAIVGAVASTGCKQDPLDGFDNSIKKGVPPKNTKTNPAKSDSVAIDVSEYHEVEEGGTLNFKIGVRVFRPESTVTAEIANLGAFPGATFNERTGEFSWVVPENFTKGRDQVTALLNVMGVTNEAPFLFDEKIVRINVLRKMSRPEILSVEGLDPVAEGSTINFTVQVRDLDGNEPILVVTALNGEKSAAGMIKQMSVAPSAQAYVWTFNMQVNLADLELTKNYDRFHFGLKAFSTTGLASAQMAEDFIVTTQLAEPEVTWRSYPTIEFTAGEENIFTFEVYDPKFEDGTLSLDMDSFCAPMTGAFCHCDDRDESLQCQIKWTPTEDQIGRYDLSGTAENKKYVYGGEQSATSDLNRYIKVTKGATP